MPDTENNPRARPSRLKRSVVPSVASIAIHAGLAAALLGITIDRFTAPPPRPARLSLESTTTALPAPQTNQPDPQPDPPPDQTAPASGAQATSPAERAEQTRDAIDQATRRLAASAARPVPSPPSRPAPAIVRTPPPPAVTFAGTQATAATRVVFAVDASGAMVTSFSFVQDELARAVSRLQPTQSFQIVLFGERTTREGDPSPFRTIPHSGDPGDLIRATAANRVLAQRWINAALPGGKSNPVEGLTRALEFEPDLVFLLARGIQRTGALPDPADQRAILGSLDAINPIDARTGLRPAVIKAIEFVEPDPTGLIEQIARSHGDGEGSLRLISPENTADPDPTDAADPPSTDPNLEAATATLASLASDAADTAVLAGVATDAESDRARAAAQRALASLADLPPPTRRTTDPRPHLLRARAALLLATGETHPPRRADLAMQALADLAPLRIADPATAADRDVLAAHANLILARPRIAHDELLALLRTADPSDPNLNGGQSAALESVLVRAQIALLDAATDLGPTSADAGRARESIAGALASERANRAIADPALHALASASLVRANLAADHADPLAPLADLATTAALDDDTRRALAAPRLDAIVRAANLPDDSLPIAALRVLADFSTWHPETAADHRRAADLHERLADESADQTERARALLIAAHHARAGNDPDRARALAFRFAQAFPDHPDAASALTLGLGTDPDADALRRALTIDPDHARSDTWRLELARLTRGTASLDLLDELAAPTRESAALALELIDEALPSATGDARTTLLARAAREARLLAGDLDPARRLMLAQSLATTDPAQADRTLADLPRAQANSADADRVRLTIAETRAADPARFPEGAPAAFATARAIAERRSPANPDTGPDADTDANLYWHAVTLWLELGARNGGPDAKAAARAHIAGLRQSHPDLGGEPWRTRLNAIAR